jgi:CheY-like chemotaxis protein
VQQILIVEDEPQILKNIETILTISGYTCYATSSPLHAIHYLQNNTPHVILCDVMMEEMNGLELLQCVQQNEATKAIPFILLTALADVKDIEKGIALGATAYITKPFTMAGLIDTIQKAIAQSGK